MATPDDMKKSPTEEFTEALVREADVVIPVDTPLKALALYNRRRNAIARGEDPDAITDADVVWCNTIDSEKYLVEVRRLEGEKGERLARLLVLRVEDQEALVDEEVRLSYGAILGPDVDDLVYWQNVAIAAIDEDYEARGEEVPRANPE